jgi:mannose/fructose/N-acetylgalactosamine-specific phosphotransferase system component IIB
MKVVLSRVDERLLHGQVIASWSKVLQIKQIFVIDDKLAKDSFMAQVLEMTAPTGVIAKVESCENAMKLLSQDDGSDVHTMLLFKNVDAPLELVKLGYPMKELDIGNMGSGPTRKAITRRVFMSDEEIGMVKELMDKGTDVYLQMLYTDPKVSIKEHIS